MADKKQEEIARIGAEMKMALDKISNNKPYIATLTIVDEFKGEADHIEVKFRSIHQIGNFDLAKEAFQKVTGILRAFELSNQQYLEKIRTGQPVKDIGVEEHAE